MNKKEHCICNESYYNDKIIEIIKYLNEDDIEILKKFKIFVEDRMYTRYEFDEIEEKIFLDFTNRTVEEFFYKNKIDINKYTILLEKFNEIASKNKV